MQGQQRASEVNTNACFGLFNADCLILSAFVSDRRGLDMPSMKVMSTTPVGGFTHRSYRPSLPAASALLPYLQEIDRNRWYTNFGPLALQFEARLAAQYAVDPSRIVTVANCTAGLTLLLQSYAASPGGYEAGTFCALPSWTFIASAAAVVQAGLIPWFLDVEQESWQLTPDLVDSALPSAPGPVAAVMPVAPFGDRVDAAAWAAFRAKHDIPVVLDAAAGFDSVTKANAPAVVSLHATKPLGVGEGGLVLAESAAQAENIRRRSNFGFDRHHEAVWPGQNAKLSEYAAAVGLASLDVWPETRAAFTASAEVYRKVFAKLGLGAVLSLCFSRCDVNTGCTLQLDTPQALAVVEQLRAKGIEARQWWGQGCHAQAAYTGYPRGPLPVTEDLARRSLALPYHPEMSCADIVEIVEALRSVVVQRAE
ncbi:DegT/DnrJ/EryC1/StrS aminotransferase [Pelagibius litoralis]|uniref:DegT/DnrJ/EryC1/StrS aminotransferase n=1 Tax=Pelagibius litoralis TaxID=374515 RepID=A0A967CBA0_9PROT|nr:DegT/DnrJ/EryC1/StrS family aminotransferase [Pelagibius litoralis]NIA68039.1 DegT/DnrJ/EryC1/StrS aminotransferase [Pelagibius litoralis]